MFECEADLQAAALYCCKSAPWLAGWLVACMRTVSFGCCLFITQAYSLAEHSVQNAIGMSHSNTGDEGGDEGEEKGTATMNAAAQGAQNNPKFQIMDCHLWHHQHLSRDLVFTGVAQRLQNDSAGIMKKTSALKRGNV